MATTPVSPPPQKKKLLSSPTTASFFSFFRTSSKPSPDSEQQQQQQPHQSRPHSFSFKRLLRYLRLIILLLAFATLILDAITLSFEVNVMGLDLSDVATQAGLLLAPDIIAMVMILVLLIYPFMVKLSQPVPYVEEPYDYSDDEYYEDDIEEEQSMRAESIRHGSNHHQEEMSEEEVLEAVRATRRRIQQELALHQDPSSRSRRGRRHREEQQQQEQEQERSSVTISPVLENPVGKNGPLAQEDEKADTTAAAAATAITLGEERTPSISPSTLKRHQRRRRNIYLTIRLICSFGLAALALYWPASNLKPPMGYMPGLDTYHHRRPPPPPPPQPTTTGDMTGNGTSTSSGGNWGRNDTQAWNNNGTGPSSRSWGGGVYNGSGQGRNGTDGQPGSGGGHHGGYGSRWCQLEEAFGDNQSAIIYCQIKTIRPAMTYVWAILVIVELCIAFMAGDFSSSKATEDAEQPLEMSEPQEQEEILEEAGVNGPIQHSSRSNSIPNMDDEASAGGMGEPTPVRSSARRQRFARITPSSPDQQG